MSKSITIFLAVLAFVGLTARTASAEDLEFREVVHITSLQAQEIGDVDGHVIAPVRTSGIASFQDGSTAAAGFVAQLDLVKGAGTIATISSLTFDDGSVLWYRTAGSVAPEGSRTLFKGTITVTGGKGRFANAKGEGSFTGVRISPLGVGADAFFDQMITVKK
jgi:hypothetical protein